MLPVNVDVNVKAYGNDAVLNDKYIRFFGGLLCNNKHFSRPLAYS